MRTVAFVALYFLASLAVAQGAGDGARGSTPPGVSQDGSRPAEGAIKGGTILPGESAGQPQKDGGAAAGGSADKLARCYQLEGTLREQCLAQERDEALSKGAEAPRAPTSAAPERRD